MKEDYKSSHTVGACITCIVVFLVMIYFVVPLADKLLTWFGSIFVSERYGGGDAAKNPGLIQTIFHGIVQYAISAYCAITASEACFSRANKKWVAATFGLFLSLGLIMFTYVIFKSDGFFISLTIPLFTSPALYLTYKLWEYSL